LASPVFPKSHPKARMSSRAAAAAAALKPTYSQDDAFSKVRPGASRYRNSSSEMPTSAPSDAHSR
jgi:hypothetical protein